MVAKRRKLSDLVKQEHDQPTLVMQPETKIESVSSELTEFENSELPRYLTFERKEARLRGDQIDQLTDLRRRLNRQKKVSREPQQSGGEKAERITENTLMRVAVDLLLSKSDGLKGLTEEELRASLGL